MFDAETDSILWGSSVTDEFFIFILLHWPKHNRHWLLPLEIWIEIFESACSDASVTFGDYNSARDRLCDCSPEWERVIIETGQFWKHLSITCLTPLTEVERHMASVLGHDLSMDVAIVLDVSDLWDPEFDEDDSELLFASEIQRSLQAVVLCLKAVTQSVRFWRRVCLSSATEEFMHAIVNALVHVPAPRLTSLLIACPSYPASLHRNCDNIYLNPPPLFRRVLPKLAFLRVLNAIVPWADPAYFSSMESIDFADLPVVAWPTPVDLVSSLVMSPKLEHLSFGGGGYLLTQQTVFPRFTLPALSTRQGRISEPTRAIFDRPRCQMLVGGFGHGRTFEDPNFGACGEGVTHGSRRATFEAVVCFARTQESKIAIHKVEYYHGYNIPVPSSTRDSPALIQSKVDKFILIPSL
ncbi:hypothetical protein B0H16DRAFT_1467456 [Mycena metata]|uniref:F-box domain-containing protein n=1 Tax=Mycena metata TaxID=1033252 RepID=A0AAD7I419_9AGAR|nr:hypothetical protein B0H16DRAFT_1467456 [Mycena metata]